MCMGKQVTIEVIWRHDMKWTLQNRDKCKIYSGDTMRSKYKICLLRIFQKDDGASCHGV